jgi:hypothetical protein
MKNNKHVESFGEFNENLNNGEIENPVSYVDRKQIENNPKWVRI